MMAQSEPILQDNKDRFVIFPVKHHDIWDLYKEMESNFRTAGEIDLQQDFSDWNKRLTAAEKSIIQRILALFAASQGVANENSAADLVSEVQYPEAKFFYSLQNMMENIHFETSSLLLDSFVKDEKEKDQLFKDIMASPAFQERIRWISKLKNTADFAERLIASAAVKQIFNSGASCLIFNLKQRGLLPGLTLSNDLYSRDKKLHSDFAVHLHNHHLVNKVPKKQIREIILEAAKIESQSIQETFPPAFLEIDDQFVPRYLEFITDRLLSELGCEKEFGTANPWESMNNNDDSKGKINLIEKRAGAYLRSGEVIKDADKLNFDGNFKTSSEL